MNDAIRSQTAELLAQAVSWHQEGDFDRAQSLYAEVLTLAPKQPDALHLLGVIAHQRGKHAAAIELIERAIGADARRWAFHSNMACALQSAGRFEQAISSYRQAIELAGESAALLSNLGTAYQDAGRLPEAEQAYRRALQLDATHAEAHYNLGNLLRETNQPAGAIQAYQAALTYHPTYAQAHVNLANLLLEEDRVDQALHHYRRALELNPRDAEAHYNLARACRANGDYAAARHHYEQAIDLRPDHAAAHMLRGLILLYQGDFSSGWSEYEWRWQKPDEQPLPQLSQPLWQGEPLDGRTILVFSEQGVGDEIMFASCLPDLMRDAEHCVVECDPRLVPLYRRSFPTATVQARHGRNEFAWLSQVRPIDFQVPVGSLPRWFRADVSKFPQSRHFLTVDPELVHKWQRRYDALGGDIKIGISWRSASENDDAGRRSISLDKWGPLLSLPGVQFVNLQDGDVAAEIAAAERRFGIEIHDWEDADPQRDLDGLAAQMAALDLVITLGNTNAHLAGALGLNVWTLLNASPSWRWMQHGESSPWYHSMRLFRQSAAEGWQGLVHRVRDALSSERMSTPRRHSSGANAPQRQVANAELKRPRVTVSDARWNLQQASIDEAYLRASQFHKSGDVIQAEALLREILRHAPNHANSAHRLGCLLKQTKRLDEAIQLLRHATCIAAARPDVHFDLAVALVEAHLDDEAESHLRKIIDIDPQWGPAYVNLGVVCERLGKADDALASCQRGVQILPNSVQAHYNLANVYLHEGQPLKAIRHYERLLELDPNFHRGHWNRGLCYLLLGEFQRGWQGYRYRELSEQVQLDKFALPEWDGSSLAGKTLLVHAEQGVGDEIMFATCLPDVIRQARHVHLTCDPRLASLFSRSFPQATVHAVRRGAGFNWQPPVDVDCYTHAGTLPIVLRPNWDSFPRCERVLVPNPQLVALWRERFAALGPGPKIGISWRAGGQSSEQRRRTCLLDHWQPLFQIPGVQLVNLQYGDWRYDCDAARQRWGITIHDWDDADPLTDLDNFAAQVAALDAIVSVGNTTIHMAGALGVPTWTVLPRVPGWRYMLAGEWLPWYKTVRLRRQTNSGDWDEVYARVAGEVQAFFSDRTTSVASSPPPSIAFNQIGSEQPVDHTHGTWLPPEKVHEAFMGALKQHRAGHLPEAERVYEQILEIDPHHADALHLSGVLLRQTGRIELALQRLAQAVAAAPDNSIFAYNYASALRDAGRIVDSIAQLRRAIELNPHLPEAHLNLGTLLHGQRSYAEAIAAYQRALTIRPDYAEAHHNIGSALRDQGKLDQAVECYRRAVSIKPGYVEAQMNLAELLRRIGDCAGAIECFDQIIQHEPQNAEACAQRAMLLLQEQRFEQGWNEWEWRWKVKAGPQPRPFRQPLWNGEPLNGKTILVHMEQGIGDEIMFASCLGDLIAQAGNVIVECESRLVHLLARSFPTARFAARESWTTASWQSSAGPIDYQIAAGSLPRVFRQRLSDFQRTSAYLRADSVRVQHWQQQLRQLGPGLKVGISWRGGSDNAEGLKRSIPLAMWTPLARLEGLHLISLQYGDHQSEIDLATRDWSRPLHAPAGINVQRDLDDQAALLASLDLLISVSNATMHMAGALGVATWALLACAPTWRWFNRLEHAAWYPSVRLLRQDRRGDWQYVIEDVASRLTDLSASNGRPVPMPHVAMPSLHTNFVDPARYP